MSKKPLIPFSWTPASWGLNGKSRRIAQAEYELTGAELEQELVRIEHEFAHASDQELASINLDQQLLEIQARHNLISKSEFQKDMKLIERRRAEHAANQHEAGSEDRKLAELDIRYQYDNDLSDKDYQRERATIQGEPWVDVIQVGFEDEDASKGFFELDWNDEFVKWLSSQGIVGRDDEDTVNKWFNTVCRTVLIQEMQDQDWGMQADEGRPDVEYHRASKPGKAGKDDGGDSANH